MGRPKGRGWLLACAGLLLACAAVCGGLGWYASTRYRPAPVVRPAVAPVESAATDPF
jgi:hypothetical protein